jgi:hypothetical protein
VKYSLVTSSGITISKDGVIYAVYVDPVGDGPFYVREYSPEGAALGGWTLPGSPGAFAHGSVPLGFLGAATDTSGNVCVVDSDHNLIYKYDRNGNVLGKWTVLLGEGTTRCGRPQGIGIDDAGSVYVSFDGGYVAKFALTPSS